MATSKLTNLKLSSELATRDKIEQTKTLMNMLPDPDDILRDNNYDFEIYRNLLTDPHLAAAIEQRKMQVQQMDYEIFFENNLEIENEAKNLIDELPIKNIANEILDAILYGYSVQEITWQIKNDKIVPAKVEGKPPEWFIYNKKNELMLRKYNNGFYEYDEGIKLPDYKFIINRNKSSYDNPYGEKILQKCYWPVTFKRSAIEYWQTMVERYGMPFLIGYYPLAATETEKQLLLEELELMIQNNVTVINESYQGKIELKESPQYEIGQIYEILTKFHNQEISKAVLSVTLTVESGQSGSYKLGEVHKDMLEYIGLTDKKLVEDGINQLLRYWYYLNYGIEDGPKVRLKKTEAIIVESAERDVRLNSMGVEFTEKYLMKRYNLESDDFKIGTKDDKREMLDERRKR